MKETKFKQTAVEWKPLREVANVVKGVQFNRVNMNEKGTFPVFNGGINESGYIEKYNQIENAITVSQGGASAGYVNWQTKKFWAGAHCYVIRSMCDMPNKYLYYYIKYNELTFMNRKHGGNIPGLDIGFLLDFLVPIPPLEEQKRIASALTAVDNLIASLDKQITKMRNIKQGTMQHLLSSLPSTTPHKPLGSISEMQRGTSITKKDVVEGAIPVISGGQTPAYYCNMSNREGKCITVAGSGEYSGFVAYWDKPIFVCDAFSIKGKKQCITKYLFYVLRNMQTKIYATKKAGGGVPHVFISSIDHFLIPIPPIEEQERIASILTAMDNQLEALEAKRKKYEMVKQGMMQQLLTGNIRLV